MATVEEIENAVDQIRKTKLFFDPHMLLNKGNIIS